MSMMLRMAGTLGSPFQAVGPAGSAPPPPFDPLSLPGLSFYFDASNPDCLLNASLNPAGNEQVRRVRSIHNLSVYYEQSSAGSRASRVANAKNGLPVLRFGSDGMFYDAASGVTNILNNAPAGVLIGVFQRDTTAGLRIALSFSIPTAGSRWVSFTSSEVSRNAVDGRRLDSESYTVGAEALGINFNEYRVITNALNYSAAEAFVRVDGVQEGLNESFATAGNTSATNSFSARISSVTTSGWRGDMCEFYFCNQIPSLEQIQAAEAHLQSKWATPALPAP